MKVEGSKETFGVRRTLSEPVAVAYPNFAKPLSSRQESPSLLNLYWRFFVAGITRQAQTGAVVPSQRFLIDRMISPIPHEFSGEVIELGSGTGVLTLRLAMQRLACRVLACEINTSLAREVQARVAAAGLQHRVRVVSSPAQAVLKQMKQRPAQERADFIISGIPLGNLDKETAQALIEQIFTALRPGGMYIQFQHSLMDRKKIKRTFSRLRTVPVLLNFPPAFVYYAWK
jgi:phospholipid N-methyltransferase